MDDTLAIDVRDLHRNYGKVEILHGVDLRVKRGAIFGLLGPSGCGQSLACLIGCLNES